MLKNLTILVITICSFLLLSSCNVLENKTQSASVLIIQSLVGVSLNGEEDSTALDSDVIINPPSGKCIYVKGDTAKVTFTAKLLSPTKTPTFYNDIRVYRYRVRYIRTDGRNIEGVDVPYSFEGAMDVYVPVDGNVTWSFDIVRTTAKEEPPLVNLIGTINVIEAIGIVDFYGEDMAGKKVTAQGKISIHFRDWINGDSDCPQ
ncbi:MAG: hypothetical protein ACUVUG_05280 [Candidatus Aminicenantia bacterium]